MKFRALILDNAIAIIDEDGYEVMHWSEEEWLEDPSVTFSNAIDWATHRPDRLLKICNPHYEVCLMDDKPQWEDEL
tara:strand:+ start:30821 stop:31048 length:228 start_codon:yes stop_codon:yes gene_type:complete